MVAKNSTGSGLLDPVTGNMDVDKLKALSL